LEVESKPEPCAIRRINLMEHPINPIENSPDRPNVGTKHEEELCNSDMAPGVEPRWTQGELPHIGWIPMTLEYLYRYALDMAYISSPGMTKRYGHSNCTSTILYIQWRQRGENPEK